MNYEKNVFPYDLILGDGIPVSLVGRRGATKVLERTFSPNPTDCPWVSEDAKT